MEIIQNISRIKENLWLIPSERFDTLTKDPGYTDSLIYLVACLILSIPIMIIAGISNGMEPVTVVLGIPLGIVFSIPIVYLVYLIQFALLKLVGGKASFLQTVQVFIYGSTSSLIFGQLPILGIIPGLIALVNVVLGSARVHQISLLRAIAALVVIPLLLIIVLGIIVLMVFGSFIYSIFGGSSMMI